MTSTPGVMTGDARIRELLLVNVFAVFKERDPVRRKNAIVANYTDDVVWSGHDGTTHFRIHRRGSGAGS
jgi:hypothetical protein